MKTYAYLRVSTILQDLEKNKMDILKLANDKKLGNVEFVEEQVSGKVSWKNRKIFTIVEDCEKGDNIIVKSTIAGAKPEDIDISVNNDILTIRGKREMEESVEGKDFIHRECYWGSFSRSIILPSEVNKGRVKAIIKRGVLTVILPKINKKKEIQVKELEE